MKKVGLTLLLSLVAQSSMATTVDEQAKSAGFTNCLETTKTLAEFLVKQNAHASHDFWNKDFVNERFFSSLIIKDYSDGDSHISLTVIPRGKQCDWSYTETYPVEKPCQIVREERLSEMKYGGSLNETTMALNNEKDLYFYLTPSETGRTCLVTKREIFYQ
ncbi:hypothetical protein [Spongiibacter marinus]|uniref:hypothetical protein n=1 Tax=Spongiibacter marinus TaxID=354246 RepID=UPI0004889329|nr:hypothetical protein [Spongiibacter marinus]